MDTQTGKIFNAAQFAEELEKAVAQDRVEEFRKRVVEVSEDVALKMRLGNKAYKRLKKRERVRELKKLQRK